jgi:hypothetical protein
MRIQTQVFCFAEVEQYMYNNVHTVLQFETSYGGKSQGGNGFSVGTHDALCEAGNGPGIDDRFQAGVEVVRGKTMRPAACQNTSTTFQSLTRRLNDLQKSASARDVFPLNRPVSGTM